MFNADVMCSTIPACEPLVGAGCCLIEPGNCKEGLGIKGCADDGGMFFGGEMCVDILECVVPPLFGAILYDDNCLVCHGIDGAGTVIAPEPIVGATAEEIDAAIMNIGPMMTPGLEALTAEQVAAIALFLDM
jgi:hypothetical protein